jgi:MoxR-like ATPase
MEERQVTIDGMPQILPSPFFVIATQNNIEMSGTFPLPEAQLDRFAARISIGYPDRTAEMKILNQQRHTIPVDEIKPVIDRETLLAVQKSIKDIHVKDFIMGYILDLVTATRMMPAVQLGGSPRGSLSLLHACQARAALQGRDAVIPDDVKSLAVAVLAHRIIVRPEHRIRGVSASSCLQEALAHVAVPTGPMQ